MTEKRFTVDDGLANVLCWEINDKENEHMTCGECATLLNKLSEENEELKQSDTITDLETQIMHLKDENEQLKQYKQAVTDILLNWSQKNITAKQLQIVIAIMEELGVEIE